MSTSAGNGNAAREAQLEQDGWGLGAQRMLADYSKSTGLSLDEATTGLRTQMESAGCSPSEIDQRVSVYENEYAEPEAGS